MELCCSINGDNKCVFCKKAFCSNHSYRTKDLYGVSSEYSCVDCYDKEVREPFLSKPRSGMTFADLVREVRRLEPQGYISVSVAVDDSRPGAVLPVARWAVYHHSYGHCTGNSPEQTLAEFKAKRSAHSLPAAPLTNVTI